MLSTNNKIDKPINRLRCELKARHLTMITLGGSIGTGLFVASGAAIAQAGPGGALLAYILIGLMVYCLMTSLGELAAYMPVSGSFAVYGARYVDDGFGFALGWNYWYNWAVTIAVDLVASQLVMRYWFPHIPGWIWSTFFLGIIFLLNIISVKGFGETEYWLSLIKIVTVVIFITIGVLLIMGMIRGAECAGWQNWLIGDAPFVGGFQSILGVTILVGFSFQGTELIGIAAGESHNPNKNIPRAVRQVFWRILLFYILTIIIISCVIPYTSQDLLRMRNDITNLITVSTFTLVLHKAGLLSAAAIMNSVILIAILSAGNSGMYASTRMLYTLALDGKAPKIFSRLSKNGVPHNALYMTTIVAGLCFISSLSNNQQVYLWLLHASGITGFIAWLGIAVSHYRFRRGFEKQGRSLSELPYRARFFPLGPVFAFIFCLVITLGQNYQAFIEEPINWNNVIATYVGIPIFILIWLGYKLYHHSSIVRYEEMIFPDRR